MTKQYTGRTCTVKHACFSDTHSWMAAFVKRSCETQWLNLASSLHPMTSSESRRSGPGGRGCSLIHIKTFVIEDKVTTTSHVSAGWRQGSNIRSGDPYIDTHQCQDVTAACSLTSESTCKVVSQQQERSALFTRGVTRNKWIHETCSTPPHTHTVTQRYILLTCWNNFFYLLLSK